MGDYLDDLVALLAIADVTVNVDTGELFLEKLRQLNADPVGRLMMAQVQRIITLQTQITDSCAWLVDKAASVTASVARGDQVYEQTSTMARNIDQAVNERNVAMTMLKSLGEIWNAAVAARATA